MEEKEINILLTSAGRRRYLVDFFKKALKGNGKVYATNSSEISAALEAADGAAVSPLIYDKNYIPFLLNFCRRNRIAAVIPLFDIDLPILSKHKKEFEDIGTRVIVSDSNIIEICNDKWKTYSFLKQNHFNTIKTYIDLKAALDALVAKEIEYPLVIKPRWGMGSLDIFIANNEQELQVLYTKVKRELQDSYLKYESREDSTRAVLIQEYITGQEYGMDIIHDLEGNYCSVVVKEKLGMRAGETDCARIVDDKDIILLGKKLSSLVKHIGNMDVDLFRKNGMLYILELNARFGGGYPFSHIAGIDLPGAIIGWLKGEKVSEKFFHAKKDIVIQKDISLLILNSELFSKENK